MDGRAGGTERWKAGEIDSIQRKVFTLFLSVTSYRIRGLHDYVVTLQL